MFTTLIEPPELAPGECIDQVVDPLPTQEVAEKNDSSFGRRLERRRPGGRARP